MLKQIWSPSHYWPVGLVIVAVAFLLRELWALGTGRPKDTLSWWVWEHLHIVPGESITHWSFGDLVTFGLYLLIFVLWLPFHFWFMRFR